MCAVHCVQLLHAILHRTDLIVFPLALQTITTAPMMSMWGKGQPEFWFLLLERKRETYQVSSVQYCAQQLCTVQCTDTWTDLTVFWIGFCLTGPISLCLDSFLYMYYCMHAQDCNMVRWIWWDWSLSLGLLLPSVLWHCWLGHLTRKDPSPIWPIMCLVGR